MTPPTSLAEFSSQWNYLNNHGFVYVTAGLARRPGQRCGFSWIQPTVSTMKKGLGFQDLYIHDRRRPLPDSDSDSAGDGLYPLILMPVDEAPSIVALADEIKAKRREGDTHVLRSASWRIDERMFELFVRCRKLPLNAQRFLIHQTDSDWYPGTFADTFPELERLTTDIATLPLDDLERHLKTLKDREKDRFQVFNVSIPADALSPWGIGVLLIVQLYFWLHLRWLAMHASAGDEAWHVPWILVYHGSVNRIVATCSSVILPPLTAAYVAWRAELMEKTAVEPSTALPAVGVLMVSLAIAALTSRSQLCNRTGSPSETIPGRGNAP